MKRAEKTVMTQLDKKIDTTLTLPRPLVNKILTHAQKNSAAENLNHKDHITSCGLVGLGAQNHKYYYPLVPALANSNITTCFSHNNPAFQQLALQIQAQQQTVFACVFTAPQSTAMPLIKDTVTTLNQHYYIMNSLDTKGVLTMQGYYRDDDDNWQKIELLLEDD